MPKGIYPRTKECITNLSLSHKGQVAWNKGKTGYSTSKKGKKFPQYSGKNHHWFGKGIKGEKSHKYIKDRSKLKKDPRKDLDTQYKYWRKEVRKRDRNICKLLSSECRGRLESHHIFDWINYPELRYVINNGITLCAFHHPRGREEEKRMIPIFQELLSVSKD